MNLLLVIGLVAISFADALLDGNETACTRDKYEKVGCFRKNLKVFPDQLANNRDTSSTHFIGEELNWKSYKASLDKLICKCFKKVKERGYKVFALGFYGECFAGKDEEAFDKMLKDEDSASTNCIRHNYESCINDKELCIGKENAEFVYKLPYRAPEKIDGGLSEWKWSECSATCGEGVQEGERTCNKPAPENGGESCKGDLTQTKACKVKECPVDGAFTEWSDYQDCTKSCGGGIKTRTRSCTKPAPRHGGKPCVGETSQSKACNNQICLGSWTCDTKYTNFNSDGDKMKAVYLDRHAPNCGNGKVMNSFKLERDSSGKKYRYRYECCTTQLPCTNKDKYNGFTDDGGDEGNTHFLDRQTVSCEDQPLSYFHLVRNGNHNKWRYQYKCCEMQFNRLCVDKKTQMNDDGDREVIFLDRHNVECPKFYAVSRFQLVRNQAGDKYQYQYRCCRAVQPSK